MDIELKNKDQQRGNYHQQKMQNLPKNLGYQVQRQQLNLSSMDSAATESEYTDTSRSKSRSGSKNKKQQKRRSISFSDKSNYRTSRSSSRSRSQKRIRTPSPWPSGKKIKQNSLTRRKKQQQQNKKKTQGLTAIQQKTCKYCNNGLCNQPLKCEFAHYKFGKIIQENKKEFSNLKSINQKLREGDIMVKLTIFKITGEEELKELIQSNEDYIAKEIEISYQCAKEYKKVKKQIKQIKKNKITSQNEKKMNIRQAVFDNIYQLQINNNEINAAQREEALKKKKLKREEKRVQNQLLRDNQLKIQQNILNIIQQQDNSSPNLQYQENDEIWDEEENKQSNDDATTVNQNNNNKYDQVIYQHNDELINYNDMIDLYANEDEESSQSQPYQKNNQEGQSMIPENENEKEEGTNYSQNKAALNNILSQDNNNKVKQEQFLLPQRRINSEEHNKLIKQIMNEQPSTSPQTNIIKNRYQLFKELKEIATTQKKIDLVQDANLMDSIKSTDSTTMKEMELKYTQQQLYDWKFICKQKLYVSSDTQNVFNLQQLKKDHYDSKQLIAYNTTSKQIDMLNIDQQHKKIIKENIQNDLNNKQINNLIIVLNYKIADQVLMEFTADELNFQITEIKEKEQNDTNPAGVNDIHTLIKIIAQMSIKIVNLNYATENKTIVLNKQKNIYAIAEFLWIKKETIFMYEVANDNQIYKIYAIKEVEDPTPFYHKNTKTFFD